MPNGASGSSAGAGTWRSTRSNIGLRSLRGPSSTVVGPALAAGGVQHREVELLVGRAEGGEQVEHLGVHLVGPGVLAVDLVDHDDRLDALGQRLADHELGLRQHALGGVDQHDGAVHHVQDALDLAAEIGVARGVDDVDAGALPLHAGDLGQDGDAALLFQVVAVQRALGDLLVLAERAGLAQQLVDQRGLAVVDVGDDGDVADIHVRLVRARPLAARLSCCRRTHRRAGRNTSQNAGPRGTTARGTVAGRWRSAAGGQRRRNRALGAGEVAVASASRACVTCITSGCWSGVRPRPPARSAAASRSRRVPADSCARPVWPADGAAGVRQQLPAERSGRPPAPAAAVR